MLLQRARQLACKLPEANRFELLRGCRSISSTPFSLAPPRTGGEGGENEGDVDGKPARAKREIISDEEIAQTPFIYNFSGVEPDHKACRLSEPVKERIWRSYTDNPEPVTIDRLAQEYRIRKQRVHAIIWLKDDEKKMEAAEGKPLETDIMEYFERLDGTHEAADGERHVKIRRTSPMVENSAAEDGEGPDWDELSAKEDAMMLHEFERRMSFNKKQMAGLIKTDIVSRRRPPGGWSYVVEELGDKGKRGKRGGKRFVAEPDGTRRGLNELEKEFLTRESLIPRRKLTAT